MAEMNKESQIEPAANRPKRSTSGLWMGILGLLSLLGLGGLVFFLDMQHQGEQKSLTEKVSAELTKKDQQAQDLTQQISNYQSQLTAIQSQLANVQQSASGKDTHFDQAMDNFSKLHTEKLELMRGEFKTALEQVQRLLGKTRSDWMISDAEYLLNVANQRLLFMGDIATARQAMEAADARLRESEDAAVFKVREQVVKELDALNKITPLDVVGLYAKINALQQAANQLTANLPYVGKQDNNAPEAKAENTDGGLLDKALGSMKGVVSIKHTNVPVAGIITKEEAQFNLQQIKVRLDMVKMALLQQNENLYLASIGDVRQWLKENFTLNAAANDFLKQLDVLEATKIQSQFPNISESLTLLKAITKHRTETDKILPKTTVEAAKVHTVVAPAVTPATENAPPADAKPVAVSPAPATLTEPVKSESRK